LVMVLTGGNGAEVYLKRNFAFKENAIIITIEAYPLPLTQLYPSLLNRLGRPLY